MLQGFGVHHALNPDPYRGVFGNDGLAYANDVVDLIGAATPGKVCVVLYALLILCRLKGVHDF